MVTKTGKEEIEEKEVEVKNIKIKRAEKYKYLGNWLGEQGNVKEQINELERRINEMLMEVKRIGRKEII